MSDDAAGSAWPSAGWPAATRRSRASTRTTRRRSGASRTSCTSIRRSIPFIVLLLGVVIFSIAAPGKFLAPLNLSLILQQVTIIAMLGIAQTLVILTAGIDLSVGAIMVLSSIVMGRTAVVYGVPVADRLPARACSSASPAAAVNGLLVTRLRLPPFIVTLGTWSIFGALNLCVFAQRDDPRSRTSRRRRRSCSGPARLIKLYDVVAGVGLDWPFLKGWVSPTARS